MKRATSRMSRISSDGPESSNTFFAGIADWKWQEFLEKEENDLFLLGIREEIVQNCMNKIYGKYMEKQAIAFTVHCAYLAWVKVLDIYYMFKDPGDLEDPKVIESWQPDEEPKPSVVDSWASECMKVKEPTPPPVARRPSKSQSAEETTAEDNWSDTMESMSFMADLFEPEEEAYYTMLSEADSSLSTRKRSIFTRTLSMPKMYLPIVEPQVTYPLCKDWAHESSMKKKSNG